MKLVFTGEKWLECAWGKGTGRIKLFARMEVHRECVLDAGKASGHGGVFAGKN